MSRCTSSMPGHTKEVLITSFSSSGRYLASGSGDCMVRFWDLTTETPLYECKGHPGWVLALAWAPNEAKVASGDKNGKIIIWDPKTGKQIGTTLARHTKFVTALVWEPLHLGKLQTYLMIFQKLSSLIFTAELYKFIKYGKNFPKYIHTF